ncbi:hypothetical protein H6P81_015063 [Aristolochia fimbriata]|uniref:Uncharacterized protein n=1 Tax=Aristolochia fimbriata TaxID=158543 RepID=A0AAV7E4F3_ARIFI|nr:hypothetical protein H6P81_015063 [Aristolochia fimbriata]
MEFREAADPGRENGQVKLTYEATVDLPGDPKREEDNPMSQSRNKGTHSKTKAKERKDETIMERKDEKPTATSYVFWITNSEIRSRSKKLRCCLSPRERFICCQGPGDKNPPSFTKMGLCSLFPGQAPSKGCEKAIWEGEEKLELMDSDPHCLITLIMMSLWNHTTAAKVSFVSASTRRVKFLNLQSRNNDEHSAAGERNSCIHSMLVRACASLGNIQSM